MAVSPKERNSGAPAKADDKEQSKLFIEKAREIGADEERSRSDEIDWAIGKEIAATQNAQNPQR
jgi:hypothetical protein